MNADVAAGEAARLRVEAAECMTHGTDPVWAGDLLRGYDHAMVRAEARIDRDAVEIARLRSAIRDVLDFEAVLPAVATVPRRILTDALEASA